MIGDPDYPSPVIFKIDTAARSTFMWDTQTWQPGEHVVFSDLNDTVALLDTERNIYYSLEGIGPFLWSRLRDGADFSQLCAAVETTFDIDAVTAKADIADWIASMASSGLIGERQT